MDYELFFDKLSDYLLLNYNCKSFRAEIDNNIVYITLFRDDFKKENINIKINDIEIQQLRLF